MSSVDAIAFARDDTSAFERVRSNEMNKGELGRRVVAHLVRRFGNLNQAAQRAGVAYSTIHKWTKGTDPDTDTISRIAAILGVEPALLHGIAPLPLPVASELVGFLETPKVIETPHTEITLDREGPLVNAIGGLWTAVRWTRFARDAAERACTQRHRWRISGTDLQLAVLYLDAATRVLEASEPNTPERAIDDAINARVEAILERASPEARAAASAAANAEGDEELRRLTHPEEFQPALAADGAPAAQPDRYEPPDRSLARVAERKPTYGKSKSEKKGGRKAQ